MIVVLSRFVVANGLESEVRQAFLDRPHAVDSAPGFLRMEVLVPQDRAAEFWLLTWWSDEESFRAWHRSDSYRESHAGIPAGLRLDPRETTIRTFDRLCE